MINHYLKIALRSLKRNPLFSIITIGGLSIGMTAAILLMLWVADEISYDRFYPDINEIYRVYEHITYEGADDRIMYDTPGPLAPELSERFAGIKRAARLTPIRSRVVFTINNENSYDDKGYFGDQDALEIFKFDFIYGSNLDALLDPNSIILTKSKAESLFGDIDPVGQTITLNSNLLYTVQGVINKPDNTHLDFSYIIPFEVNRKRFRQSSVWQDQNCYTYVQIDKTVDYKEVENQISNVLFEKGAKNIQFGLEPLKRSYLFSVTGSGAISNVRIFSLIAILVLLIACINFINLTTARSGERALEVSLRKTTGGSRIQLIKQFLGESFLVAFFSFITSILLSFSLLPLFNNISGKLIIVGSDSVMIFVIILMVTLFAGIISGIYPAFVLSSFRPIGALKSDKGPGSKIFRTILVLFQFTLSVGLIVATMVVNRQMNYMTTKDLGFKKDNIAIVGLNAGGREKYELFKEELLRLPGIEDVAMSNGLPNTIGSSTNGVSWVGKNVEENTVFHIYNVSHDLPEVFGMELISGRSWDMSYATDSMTMVINEQAVKAMSLDNPVGTKISMWDKEYQIIGVVKDFNFQSLKQDIGPLLMFISMNWQNNVCIRIKQGSNSETMQNIEKVWNDVYEGELFRISLFDSMFENVYDSEAEMRKLFLIFSLLAIIISGLGLFGLTTFMAEKKYKEIAIRKALGASVGSIVWGMVWSFFQLVLVANITGSVIAIIAMKYWLNTYAFRISFSADFFINTILITTLTALLTVVAQSCRASLKNPVEALGYE